MWIMIANAGWILAAALFLWMLYDWFRVDTTYSEATLTSSREGEIEAFVVRLDPALARARADEAGKRWRNGFFIFGFFRPLCAHERSGFHQLFVIH